VFSILYLNLCFLLQESTAYSRKGNALKNFQKVTFIGMIMQSGSVRMTCDKIQEVGK
jgi:hypothetical protein